MSSFEKKRAPRKEPKLESLAHSRKRYKKVGKSRLSSLKAEDIMKKS
jgi:hypothetical protein